MTDRAHTESIGRQAARKERKRLYGGWGFEPFVVRKRKTWRILLVKYKNLAKLMWCELVQWVAGIKKTSH